MREKTGCVYLVGAGCGAADLITVRGLRVLTRCDVVVYDDLIAPELLAAAPVNAEKIYMGKRLGRHSAAQTEITEVLVKKAAQGHVVARLKGGDPFVFGRGGEEAQALQAAGIPYEEVPGITSAVAIPAAAGIPVTHRGLSRSLHIITGHTADNPEGIPEAFHHLVALHGTLVFLMGLSNLETIADGLICAGMGADTPGAVISGGNTSHPAVVRAPLGKLAAAARQARVEAPAVIVVGEVAGLNFSPTLKQPLAGVRVGLTGTAEIIEKLYARLQELGAQVFFAQRSVVEKLPLDTPVRTLCEGGRHWLVFTSSNGVKNFFNHLREEGTDVRCLAQCSFAVIGAATGEILARYGIHADLCPEVYTSAALARELVNCVKPGEDVLIFRSAQGSAELPKILEENRISWRDIPIYELRSCTWTENTHLNQLDSMDYLTFSSASGVELYFRGHAAIPERTTCVCIGEVTAAALRVRLDRPFCVAKEISAEGIVQMIAAHHEGAAAYADGAAAQ